MYYVLILSHCGEVCCGVLATLLGHKCIISHWPQLILAKVDRFQLSCMTNNACLLDEVARPNDLCTWVFWGKKSSNWWTQTTGWTLLKLNFSSWSASVNGFHLHWFNLPMVKLVSEWCFAWQRCKNLIYNWDDAVSIMEFPLCQMTSEDSGSTALSRNLYTVHCGVAILRSWHCTLYSVQCTTV